MISEPDPQLFVACLCSKELVPKDVLVTSSRRPSTGSPD